MNIPIIPKEAQRVFKGVNHDIYHWEQIMFDGSVKIFEAIKRNPSVTIIAVTIEGKIIILEEEQPYYGKYLSLPGGVSVSNNLLQDAKRELQEETGYESSDWKFYKKIDILNYSQIEWQSYFYIAKNCRYIASPNLDSGEKVTVKLYSFDEFLRVTQLKKFKNTYITTLTSNMKDNYAQKINFKKLLGLQGKNI